MNPDNEDSNNHVPKVSPGDIWDNPNQPEKSEIEGLPPRRLDAGLSPRKDSKRSFVKRSVPVLKPAPPELGIDDVTSRVNDDVLPNPEKKNSYRSEKQDAKVHTFTAREMQTEEDFTGVLRLPTGQPDRHSRLYESGSSESSVTPNAQIAFKVIPKHQTPDDGVSEDETARTRRRFVSGERGDWGDDKGHSSSKWMAYTGLGIILLVIVAVVLSQKSGRKEDRESKKSVFSDFTSKEESGLLKKDDAGMLDMLTNGQEKAAKIYARYATAKTPEELSDSLYRHAEMLPLLRKKWQPLGAKSTWQPNKDTPWAIIDRDGSHFGLLQGANEDFSSYTAFFRKDGKFLKMDWKATTGYGTATFDELNKGSGDGSEIRTTISRVEFYTFSLPEGKYHSFRLMSPDGSSTLWAYTESGSKLDEEMLKLFALSDITGEAQSKVQVILSLTPSSGESLPNQWLISDLVSLSWLDK